MLSGCGSRLLMQVLCMRQAVRPHAHGIDMLAGVPSTVQMLVPWTEANGRVCTARAGCRAGALMRILLNEFVVRGFFSEDALLMARFILGWNYQSTCCQVYLRMVVLLVVEYIRRLTVTLPAGPGRPAVVLGPAETQPVLEQLAEQCTTAAQVRRAFCGSAFLPL